MDLESGNSSYPFFQVWRPLSSGSTIYNKRGEIQLQSDNQVTEVSGDTLVANISLSGNDRIEFQSGDVVGYYHPPQSHYQVRTLVPEEHTQQYKQFLLSGLAAKNSINLAINSSIIFGQPMIQFTIGKLTYKIKLDNALLVSCIIICMCMH